MSEFGFDENTQEGTEFRFILVRGKEDAIREGIFLEDLKLDTWKTGNSYLEIIVKNKQDQTANKRYNKPIIDSVIKDEKALKEANAKFSKICKNITTKILGENVVIEGNTFEEFVTNMINKIKSNPKWNKTELRTVFVHNKDGFTTLRSYSPIFELASVPKDKSHLIISDTYDKYVEKQNPSNESTGFTTNPIQNKEDIF